MPNYSRTGRSIGTSLASYFQAMEAEKKKGKQKKSTLLFLDDLSGIFGDESIESPDDLLLPSQGELSPEEEALNEIMGFMSGESLDDDEGSLPGTIGMAPGRTVSPEQEKNQKVEQLINVYRSALGQESDLLPGAQNILKDIGGILTPQKGRGQSFDERAELERLKGNIRSKQSEELYDLKEGFQSERHRQQMELQNKKNQYAFKKMEQSSEDRVRSLTLKSEGADILNQVIKGDKEPQAALSQIDAAIRDLDSDIKSRTDELNQFEIDHPEAARAARSAITDLQKSRRELSGYQRRIMDKAGKTPQYENNQKELGRLQKLLEKARKTMETATGDRKAKYQRAIANIERKIQDLE